MASFEEVAGLLAVCKTAGPATDEMVANAEHELGVKFPGSYRLFVAKFGAALCRGFEIAGLIEVGNQTEPPLWSDVVATTMQLRHASHGSLPAGYVAISDDGGDYTFFLDTTRQQPEDECPVVVLGPGADGVAVASDFLDFVVRAFANRLEF